MNNTTRITILSHFSQPDKDINYDGGIVEYKGKRYFVRLERRKIMSENNLFNINVGTLISIFINNQIDNDAVIMTDSGWECDETEVNMVYYNAKTNVVIFCMASCREWSRYFKKPRCKYCS